MKIKNLATILVALAVITIPNISGAQGGYGNGNGSSSGSGVHEAGTGIENPELKEENQGTGLGMQNDEDEDEDVAGAELDEDAAGTEKMNQEREMAQERMSDVANFVQAMEKIATRNGGIGDQIRVIAQNQNNIQEEAEDALQEALERKGFTKFLIGPNYGKLKDVEDRLELHTKNLEELQALRGQVTSTSDRVIIDEQIAKMEEIKAELEKAVSEEQSGFSLFGWLNKILSK